jgi:hypothetical protein
MRWTVVSSLGIASLCASTPASAAAAASSAEVRVVDERTFVYEQPSLESALIRRLYAGEVLTEVERVIAPDKAPWVKVKLGEQQYGYVRAEKVGAPGTLPVSTWAAPEIVRNLRPLALGLKVGGETMGAAVNIRYQPFTRLGLSFTSGGVMDTRVRWHGTHNALGLYSCFILWNLSPMIEMGVSSTTYGAGNSELRLINYYFVLGVEWMFNWGAFINVYASYIHSMDTTVAYSYADSHAGTYQPGSYGSLEPENGKSFTALRPGVTIGYAF